MDRNLIYDLKIKACGEFIGSKEIDIWFGIRIICESIRNFWINFIKGAHRKIKIWAITDNENNYNVYIENYEDVQTTPNR